MSLGAEILAELRGRLARDGLHVALSLPGAVFDEVCRAHGGARLSELLPGAEGAVLIGDGGPELSANFQSSRAAAVAPSAPSAHETLAAADPLDDFTRLRVAACPADVLGARGLPFRVLHPFVHERPALPFQRLGQAAGLPAPGPLGLQVHPLFGPWWAYRACLIVPFAVAAAPALEDSCAVCPRPCVPACPGEAVAADGFRFDRCLPHRHVDPACHQSCAARLRCPVGAPHRYPPEQLGFHMRASLISLPSQAVRPPPRS